MTSDTVSASAPDEFIRSQTRVLPAQFVPEVRMHTADEVFELWDRTDRRAASGEVQPPRSGPALGRRPGPGPLRPGPPAGGGRTLGPGPRLGVRAGGHRRAARGCGRSDGQ
ncbi:hypothetical protein ACFQZC_07980 [Streptacidiphilus monticola]